MTERRWCGFWEQQLGSRFQRLWGQQVSGALRSAEHRPGPWSGIPLSSWVSVGQGLHHPELQPPLPLGEPAPHPRGPRSSRSPTRPGTLRQSCAEQEPGFPRRAWLCSETQREPACVLARSIFGSQRRELGAEGGFGDQMSRESPAASLISSPPGPAPAEPGRSAGRRRPHGPCSGGL